MNILTKILFKITKPTLVLLAGEERALAIKALCHILGFQPGITFKQLVLEKIVILPLEDRAGFLKNSSKIILGLSLAPEPLLKELYDLNGLLQSKDVIIYASESKKGKKMASASKAECLSFGVKIGDDLIVSDIKRDSGSSNLKISVRGNTVPIWLNGSWNKLEVYAGLLTIYICLQLGSNLVRVSQSLKSFEK